MAMPAVQFDDDPPVVDPDQLKMPEAAAHRGAVDLIGLAATRLLGPDTRVFRDLNWYPTDGGGPMAPDLMVLPAGAVEPSPTSYRQDQTGGPPPMVVVEVPSESDTFVSFRAKAFRYQGLGTVVYLVVVEGPRQTVLRLGPNDDGEPRPWVDQPIAELGGLRLGFDGGELVAITPAGVRAARDVDLLTQAEDRATAAEERAEALLRQLQALGVEPPSGPAA